MGRVKVFLGLGEWISSEGERVDEREGAARL